MYIDSEKKKKTNWLCTVAGSMQVAPELPGAGCCWLMLMAVLQKPLQEDSEPTREGGKESYDWRRVSKLGTVHSLHHPPLWPANACPPGTHGQVPTRQWSWQPDQSSTVSILLGCKICTNTKGLVLSIAESQQLSSKQMFDHLFFKEEEIT